MQIRNAETADRNTLHCIYAYAREQMAMNGNANQWIAGYPSDELIDEDITQGHSYVCLADDGHIAGVFRWWVGEEPTYTEIYDGKWLDDEPYGVIHRIASDGTVHGLMNFCLQWCMERHPNIRIDTHKDNRIMQHLLQKSGFTYCGIIRTHNGTPRLAYQKRGANINRKQTQHY